MSEYKRPQTVKLQSAKDWLLSALSQIGSTIYVEKSQHKRRKFYTRDEVEQRIIGSLEMAFEMMVRSLVELGIRRKDISTVLSKLKR